MAHDATRLVSKILQKPTKSCLLGPTFRHLTARCFIELLPPQELLHVGLRVMFVFLVPGLYEVQVVNRLSEMRLGSGSTCGGPEDLFVFDFP